MNEATYNATLTGKLKEEYGGKTVKLADRATLGLPDSLHSKDGIVTFLECKIGKPSSIKLIDGALCCELWKCINDRRQYEFCKILSKCATMIYCIYWPHIRMSAVIPIETLELFKDSTMSLKQGQHFVEGHGVEVVIRIIENERKKIYAELRRQY